MAEYHVGCGAFGGIFAGTVQETKNGLMWKNKSDVTQEAIGSVVQYYKDELKARNKTKFHTQYEFKDGTIVNLDISIAAEKDRSEIE